MLKNLLATNTNKEFLGIASGVSLVILLIINLVILVPVIIEISSPIPKTQTQELIDTQAVNEALKLLDVGQ